MKKYLYFLFTGIFIFIGLDNLDAQCCAAGSGSPIAGGGSQGVLLSKQFEISSSFQNISTHKFLQGDQEVNDFLKDYNSQYNYLRFAYGVTKNLTFSVETGYYFNKKQVHLNDKVNESSGIGDLIIFPRYDIINHTEPGKTVELTAGLGLKIPVGNYNDTIQEIEPFSGTTYTLVMPPAIQPTTGSNDFIFYVFGLRGFPLKKFKVFANALYIKKGYNPSGEKFGDYASIGLFVSKTLLKKLGLTLQLKGEWVDQMEYNEDVYQSGSLNYDVFSTGSKKLFFVPQVSYPVVRNLTLFALTDLPLYQYVNGTQIASQNQFTVGLSYRFFM